MIIIVTTKFNTRGFFGTPCFFRKEKNDNKNFIFNKLNINEINKLINYLEKHPLRIKTENFLIYSPENTALRTFEKEGQIQPLGINGEGLLKLLKVVNNYKIILYFFYLTYP